MKPFNHPIEEIVIDDFRLTDDIDQLLDLDEPDPDSVTPPTGVKFNELYVFNPKANISESFTVQAKGRCYTSARLGTSMQECAWENG